MADYTPRLKASYNEVVRPAMKEEFAYKNDMMIPKITKITLNIKELFIPEIMRFGVG